ncbi:MAG: hypothetical protein NUV57_02815 [archaeon]|nr:hypothetical protein [archaeon]
MFKAKRPQPPMQIMPKSIWVKHASGVIEFVQAGQKVPKTSSIMTSAEIKMAREKALKYKN